MLGPPDIAATEAEDKEFEFRVNKPLAFKIVSALVPLMVNTPEAPT